MISVTIAVGDVDYVYGPYPTPEDAAAVEARVRAALAWEEGQPSISWGRRLDTEAGANQQATERTARARARRAGQLEMPL